MDRLRPAGCPCRVDPGSFGCRRLSKPKLWPRPPPVLSALPSDGDGEPIPEINDFPEFARAVFGWGTEDLYGAPGAPAVPDSLEAPLPSTTKPSVRHLHCTNFSQGLRARVDSADQRHTQRSGV